MISTHVLDAMTGRPAAGLSIVLEQRLSAGWTVMANVVTDADGRVRDLPGSEGVHRLTFATEEYLPVETFYPEVVIVFRILDAEAHHHVPLLLSPFAYSTYRGS